MQNAAHRTNFLTARISSRWHGEKVTKQFIGTVHKMHQHIDSESKRIAVGRRDQLSK